MIIRIALAAIAIIAAIYLAYMQGVEDGMIAAYRDVEKFIDETMRKQKENDEERN